MTTKLEDAVEFAENPEQRTPCVLLLDTSGSMQGASIEALNEGLKTFKDDLVNHPLAIRRVELAIVSFDSSVQLVQDFVTAEKFEPPTLTAQGQTHMGAGIIRALDLIQARKDQYKANGVAYTRPWLFLISDGEPQGESDDTVQQAASRLRTDEERKRVAAFAVAVENANIPRLSEIVVRPPLKLRGLAFKELFVWLSGSMGKVSSGKADDQVALPPPGWAVV